MTIENNPDKKSLKDENLVSSSFIEFLFILAKWKKFLLIFISICILAGTLVAILTPIEYKATASVLPAEQSDLLSSLSGISSLAKSFSPFKGLSSLSGQDESDKYIAILKSATVLSSIISKFNIRKAYDMEDAPMWKVVKKLKGNLEFTIEDEGNLTIDVYDENPQLAANIANHLVDLLNNINSQLHVTNAKAVREFVEKRYLENANDIIRLELEMKSFQKKYGVIAVPEQLEATFKTLSTLYADLALKEIEYNVLKKTIGSENPALNIKSIELHEFKEKLVRMNSDSESSSKALIPLSNAPELIGQYLNIFKNLEIQYKIAEFITPVYEQAKIEEIRNTPSVLTLDRASTPERKARPKISLYMLISLIVSVIMGFFIVFACELFKKMQIMDPEKYYYVSHALIPFRKKSTSENIQT